MAATRRSCARAPLQKGLLLLSLALALLLCAACTADASPYTPSEDLHTRKFLLLLAKNIPTLRRIWDLSVPHYCSLKGVSCKQDGVGVFLSDLQLSGRLPELDASIDTLLVQVSTLVFKANPGIVGTLPKSWADMPNLQRVDLKNTGVRGTLPAEWSRMGLLDRLDLSGTALSGELPYEWSRLSMLSELNLDGTHISGTLPQIYERLSNLHKISLAKTAISGTLPAEWGHMNSLETVTLANTGISGTLPTEWVELVHMMHFDVSNTAVNGTLPAEWDSMSVMRVLLLHSTQLSGTIPSSWDNMTQLEEINLANTQLTGCVPMTWLRGRYVSTAETGLTSSLSAHCLAESRVPAGIRAATRTLRNAASALLFWIVLMVAAVAVTKLWLRRRSPSGHKDSPTLRWIRALRLKMPASTPLFAESGSNKTFI